ncbi:MAG TPA: lipopolysaccharide biosynthesis protein [Gemmatimonadaceae bacterium]|nr:lipopolysaccharide biosynthesis protein [Gemmatimonadaceae bacterium]
MQLHATMDAMAPEPDANTSSKPLQRSALDGFLWLSAGNGVRAVLKIGVLAILGRLLTPADFGLVAAAAAVVWFTMIFSSLGVGPALVQRRELEPEHISTSFAFSLLLGLTLGALIAIFAPAIARVFRLEGLAPVLRGIAIVFPISALSTVSYCLLQRQLRFRAIAGAELISYAIGYGGVGVAMALLGYGVWALVGAEVSKEAVKSALLLRALPESRRLRFHAGAFMELLHFGSGYTAGGIATYIALEADSLVVARFLGASALGLYGRAYELMLVPAKALGDVLNKILFPALSRVQDDPGRLALGYRRSLGVTALLVIPASVGIFILAPEIIATLLGGQWLGAVTPLRILILATYFQVGYMVGQSVANATGVVYGTAWRSGAYAILVVLGAVIGQRWGIVGVAAGVAFAIIVNFLLVAQLNARVTGLVLRELIALHLPALALAAPTALAAWGSAEVLRHAGAPALLVLLVAAAVTSVAVLIVLRLLQKRLPGGDVRWLMDIVSRHAPRPLRSLLTWAASP